MNRSPDAQLDALLDSYEIAAAAPALVDSIVASAAVPAAASPRAPDAPTGSPARWSMARWLWPGAGLAGIGLAGSFAGAMAVSVALQVDAPPPGADWPDRITAFTEPAPEGTEE